MLKMKFGIRRIKICQKNDLFKNYYCKFMFACTNWLFFYQKDNSFIIDVVNDETNMKAELSTWNEGYFENKSAPQNKEFIFNDVTYTGVYEQSIIRKWESYTTNIYVDTMV